VTPSSGTRTSAKTSYATLPRRPPVGYPWSVRGESPRTERHWVWALPLLLVALPSAQPPRASAVDDDGRSAMPHPATRRLHLDAASANADCQSCHEAIGEEWRASMHSQAHTDPVYQRALATEPLPFCRGCHAPEADPRSPPSAALGRLGVACITCHVPENGIGTLATAERVGAPHPVLATPAFAAEAACASCHEFDFPAHAPGHPAEKMQATVSEHAASPGAARPCAACHMPFVGEGGVRHRSHRFDARTPEVLRSALVASARRTGPRSLAVSLAPGSVGHAFPTGDLFRRLRLSAEAIGDDWTVMSEASRAMSRHFRWRDVGDGHVVREQVGDDRVGAGQTRTVELDIGVAGEGRPLAWRVEYQRVEHPAGGDDADAVVAESVVVASGLLAAEPGGPPTRGD
jgi:Cytochrome c554 and c-prime